MDSNFSVNSILKAINDYQASRTLVSSDLTIAEARTLTECTIQPCLQKWHPELSKFAYSIIEKEYLKSRAYSIHFQKPGEYLVSKTPDPSERAQTSLSQTSSSRSFAITQESSTSPIKCQCNFFERTGLVCRHILKWLSSRGDLEEAMNLVHIQSRWFEEEPESE
jgi:hypothetical protein